jgi:hypothetical protein
MAHFIYKMVIISSGGPESLKFEVTLTVLLLSGSDSMVLLTLTATNAVICMSNFRTGLRAHLKRYEAVSRGMEENIGLAKVHCFVHSRHSASRIELGD